MDFFTDENIIEPLMNYYKDYNYIIYILNLPFKSGFKLYLKCIANIKNDIKKENENKIFSLWLVHIQHGYKESFKSFYEMQTKIAENKSLGYNFRESEEKRILKDLEGKKNTKLKEVKLKL